jgi:hypothetical protein
MNTPEDDDDDDAGRPPPMDFGSGVTGRFHGWMPDRSIEAIRARYEGLADIDKVGMSFNHPRKDGGNGRCGGFVTFDLPGVRGLFPNHALWTVESWEPLTLSPSLLCRTCGRHGFIRQGRWVEA